MKCRAALLLSLWCLMPSLRAVNVSVMDFMSGRETVILRSTGELMPNGALVRLGYFSGFGTTWPEAALHGILGGDPAEALGFINDYFVPLGEGGPGLGTTSPGSYPAFRIRTINGSPMPGRLTGFVSNVTSVSAPPNEEVSGGVPAGSRLFMIVGDGPTPEMSTEFGIFSATTWLMPAVPMNSMVLNTVQVDTTEEVYRGMLSGGGNAFALHLTPVIPEPGVSALAVAAGALLARRRRLS